MLENFDLWNWQDVRLAANRIRARVEARNMPPGGWPSEKIELYGKWVDDGCPRLRTEKYLAFFKDLDSYTEYTDIYRPELNGEYMRAALIYLGSVPTGQKAMNKWWKLRHVSENS